MAKRRRGKKKLLSCPPPQAMCHALNKNELKEEHHYILGKAKTTKGDTKQTEGQQTNNKTHLSGTRNSLWYE